MKILFVHAHYDDYEFAAAGTFELWRRKLGPSLSRRVLVCTDGKAGHQFRTREETGEIRKQEQDASAKIGGYEWELLRLPDGRVPREACLLPSVELLAALWNAIRRYEPDILFCPPVPADPLAGIHVDHVAIGEAVRKVAYMLNVPHAFTPEYPQDERTSKPCKVPVIVNVYDSYTGTDNPHDLAVDVSDAFDLICDMSWCHQSQIAEWLPWVGRHKLEPPASKDHWREMLLDRFRRKNRQLGIVSDRPLELFTVSAWGEIPDFTAFVAGFPNVVPELSNLPLLKKRLERLAAG